MRFGFVGLASVIVLLFSVMSGCVLRIKNCKLNYQGLNDMKREYQCFLNNK